MLGEQAKRKSECLDEDKQDKARTMATHPEPDHIKSHPMEMDTSAILTPATPTPMTRKQRVGQQSERFDGPQRPPASELLKDGEADDETSNANKGGDGVGREVEHALFGGRKP